jgi:hypothetical protein
MSITGCILKIEFNYYALNIFKINHIYEVYAANLFVENVLINNLKYVLCNLSSTRC